MRVLVCVAGEQEAERAHEAHQLQRRHVGHGLSDRGAVPRRGGTGRKGAWSGGACACSERLQAGRIVLMVCACVRVSALVLWCFGACMGAWVRAWERAGVSE